MKALRAARSRVARVRSLLLDPSPANLEICGQTIAAARGLLDSAAADGPCEGVHRAARRAEARALREELEAVAALVRHAAGFYLECVRLGDAGTREYGPVNALPAARPARLLAEG